MTSSDPAHKVSSTAIDEAKNWHVSDVSSAETEGSCTVVDDVADSEVAGADPVESSVSLQAAMRVDMRASAAATRPTWRAVKVV